MSVDMVEPRVQNNNTSVDVKLPVGTASWLLTVQTMPFGRTSTNKTIGYGNYLLTAKPPTSNEPYFIKNSTLYERVETQKLNKFI